MLNHQENDASKRDRIIREQKQNEHRRDYKDANKQYVRKDVWLPAANIRFQKV